MSAVLIRDIVDMTCRERHADITMNEKERADLSEQAWLVCGLDKGKLVPFLHEKFLEWEKRFFRKV